MWLCARWSLSLYGRQIEDKDEMSSSLTHRTFIHTLDQERYKFHLFLIENTWVKCVCINEDICFFLKRLILGYSCRNENTHTKCLAYKSHVCPVTLGDMQYRTRMYAEHEYKQQNVLHAFIPDWYNISVYSALIMGQVLGGKKERDFLF